jgi:hypothetical protein
MSLDQFKVVVPQNAIPHTGPRKRSSKYKYNEMRRRVCGGNPMGIWAIRPERGGMVLN